MAIVSLLVATGVGALTLPGNPAYLTLALTLALLVGIIQLTMGVVQLGFLVNFLSHPVLSGFTSAAALVIGFSQLKHLLGISIPRTHALYDLLLYAVQHRADTNLTTLSLGLGSIVVLLFFAHVIGPQLTRRHVPMAWREPITKSGPLVVVCIGTLLVWGCGLNEHAGVSIIGSIPAGLPPLTLPLFAWTDWAILLPIALTISVVGFMESIAVAKSLASKRRQKVDANQELVALGVANLGAAFTGGYPVTGGFSRSVVNFNAGANTGLASIITAVLIAVTVLLLMPLLYFLPQVVLAAIIIVAVGGLVDVATLRHVWRYNRVDAVSLLITFGTVLLVGIEIGIGAGVTTAVVLYLWRTSRPHVAIVGRVGDTEHFRNVLRHAVHTCPHVLTIRMDESLYFANTKYIEDLILAAVADHPAVKHLVLVCSAINDIDASALETLENLIGELRDAGVTFHLAEVKGPVMDRLQRIGFLPHLGDGRIFLSTHQAMQTLGCE